MSQFYIGVTAGELPPSVATTYETNNGNAVPSANILNIVGGAGIVTSGGSNTVTITNTGAGFAWNDQTTSPQTLAVENGYVTDSGGAITYNLPAVSAFGTEIAVVGKSGSWIIQCGAGQQILLGNASSSVGGSISSTNLGDCVQLLCITANTTWRVLNCIGNITLS